MEQVGRVTEVLKEPAGRRGHKYTEVGDWGHKYTGAGDWGPNLSSEAH